MSKYALFSHAYAAMTDEIEKPRYEPKMLQQDTSELVPPETATQPETPKPPKKRRLLKYLIGGCVVLLGGVAVGATWLLNTESGLRFAVYQLPKYAHVQITSDTLSGTILDGFSADKIRVQTEKSDLDISSLNFQWQAQELWQKHLHINRLSIGDIHITPKPTPPEPDSPPPQQPDSIGLPFTVALDVLEIGKITQGEDKLEILGGALASYTYNHQQHNLQVKSLKTHWANTEGSLKASTQSPFALQGTFLSNGMLDDIEVENILDIKGSLNDILLTTDLTGNGVGLHADTQVRPFATNLSKMIGRIRLEGQGVNPQAFLPNLPRGNLFFLLDVKPHLGEHIALDGSLDLRNENPETSDHNGIPVTNLVGKFHINDSGAVDIAHASADLMKNGQVSLSGGIYAEKQTLNLTAELNNITAADVISTPIQGVLNGTIRAHGTFDTPQANWQLHTERADSSGSLKIVSDSKNKQQTLHIEKGIIKPKDGGELQLSGSLELFQNQKLQAEIKSAAFNPAKLYPDLPEGNVNGSIKAIGELAKLAFHTEMAFAPSTLSGAPLSGSGKVSYENNHLSRADAAIKLGNNLINTQGAFGKKGDTLAVDINAPQLDLFGFGLQGLLTAKGTLTSTADNFTQLDAKLDGQARGFSVGNELKIQHADFRLHGSPDPNRPLDVMLKGNGIVAGGTAIDNVDAALNGSLRQHAFKAVGSLKIDDKPLTLNLGANGGLNDKNQWHGTVNTLDVSGALQLRLQNAMKLEAGAERVVMSAARWSALNGSLNLDSFVWDKQAGLTTKGNANGLQLEQLHNFYAQPVQHNLVIAADWDMAYSNAPRGFLNVKQQSGDVILPNRKQPLNLQNFVVNSTLDGRGIHSKINANTALSQISGNYSILQAFGNGALTAAPVSGSLKITVDDLATSLKSVMPVGQIIKGSLNADVAIGGTVGEPKFNGTINGENLYYRNRQVGVILDNGSLKSRVEGQKWLIDALQFKRKGGTVTLAGSAAYLNEAPDVNAKLSFDRYPILDQPSRRLTLSGDSDVLYTAQGVTLNGSLKTDEGRFGFQESSAPTLDDDVVIIGESKPAPAAPMPFKLNLIFDLADKFHFSGEGLNVDLGGSLKLTSSNTSDVNATGSVNVIRGRYKAYGQDLIIKKGIISFVGPITRPNLNIRAERRNSPVGAGVEVLGNLEAPRVNLVANDPMSEKDKLSWLILNRASSGTSTDEAALATAAGAFLAGRLNDKVGLVDDFGLSSQQTRNATTGEMNPAQQVLTFGKQINRDIYLGYEAGLETASQSVKLVYQLSRSFQAIMRAGTESSGGEIKYIKRFD
ncbi:translocation/assembly module TamB domain-containing protein [Wielerella bovis]|uniref:translocation/assembly module TamB domain-containing protein n=1 Tax=Wielerella bovis TaxID=2917790 RepID=UPI002019BE22|nr:translocation/assembly module TamB domain-containing protein [Wielerella bovis]MCG7656314.1 translocation/assembly module TamB domain-containing protein [Wielerella bovis]MCG7658539.1 translocation/assembly module TamB domain-containing protein [Wielerella bovis]